PILLQGGATGVQLGDELSITAPHSRKRTNTALFSRLPTVFFLCFRKAQELYNVKNYIIHVEPDVSRLSPGCGGSLPSQGRPPQLFPAPRTVETWSSQRICGK
ncbi:hypothetical protein XENORESO_018918, partial [Xenotaenia resolanae]